MANSVDPDQMLHSAASDLGLECLLKRSGAVCPNTWVNKAFFSVEINKILSLYSSYWTD